MILLRKMGKNLTIGDEIVLKYIVIYKILTRHKNFFPFILCDENVNVMKKYDNCIW